MALIPDRYDVLIDGHYFRFADWEQRRALYSFSPTFVERQNVQGDYGDNQFDFYLTWTQRDWSLGEQQKFYRQDENRSRKVWLTQDVDVRTPGEVTLRSEPQTVTFPEAPVSAAIRGGINDNVIVVSATKMYQMLGDGSFSAFALHGVSNLKRFGVASDGAYVYVSSFASGVKRWSGDPILSFSADGADSIEFLNNSLYGLTHASRTSSIDANEALLVRWDTAGNRSTVFPWRQIDGDPRLGRVGRLRAFGGRLLILWSDGQNGPELWEYDGIAPQLIANFPRNFFAHEMEVVSGVVFISGSFVASNVANYNLRPAIYFYANGTQGVLWRSTGTITSTSELEVSPHPAVVAFDDGLVFSDPAKGSLVFYDITVGGIHRIATYSNPTTNNPSMISGQRLLLLMHNDTDAYIFPEQNGTKVSTGSVIHSLVDFDSSLLKWVKSISFDGIVPTGSTVDLSYRLDDADGSYTTLQTNAVPGTEYRVGASGRAISVKVTLNKGSSSAGPTLKRVFARAVPIAESFKYRNYILDLSGRNGESQMLLRDGTLEARDGMTMANQLATSAVATTPFNITDRFGTYEGVIEGDSFQIIEIRPEEFVAVVKVRQV